MTTLKRPRYRKKNSILSILLTYALLISGALLTVLPLVFSITTSLRTERDLVQRGALSLPGEVTFDNYVRLFTEHDFIVPLAVTIQVVAVMVVGQFVSSILAAYAFARLEFPGRQFLFWAYISTMMIPAIVTMIPLFTMMSEWGLRNTFAGIVLPFMLGSPYAIFLLRQSFMALPQEILDAAELDGAGFWRQLWSIALPMNRPILVTLLLITVVSQWNNFLWPSIVSPRKEWNVLTVATAGLQSQYAANWTLVMAATTLSILPLLILFVAFNKQIVRSIGISSFK
ncbi:MULTISPECIES: carbohydrate ABC transporter permease [Trueperella]|uniref:Multiple sugar transport system permease protein n=1 Tax=Trueperella abortisuis TaxID=445930 RepID=A0ABT9PFD8_9ACTO|nr:MULTISPECIES: carbohydrate ABC transporter permease [Trueperella]MCI7306104.1 carbohydrate ABC transporter permease [Trueperella sp.]MDP9831428.1 multiple sugar transport system permease protein [Trueperella abortisuis]MDY5403317.1 carbohydrate ABC transporter permease [Trueperella sp.]